MGYLIKETDEEGNVTEHGYNIWGEEVKRIDKNTDGSGDQFWEIKYNYFGQVKEEKRNNGQIWNYKYNKRGLLEEKTDPKGILQKVMYDECGLKTKETYTHNGTSQSRSFKYDSEGNLYYASDNGITSYINYENGKNIPNAYGLILQNKTTVNGRSLTTKYDYDKGKRISKVVYPDSVSVCLGYNGIGLLKEIGSEANTTAYAKGGKYDTVGNLKELTAGNTTKLTQTIDEAKNLLISYSWGISVKNANTLIWNNRGNITAQSKNGISYTYEYDKKNQLTREKWEGEDKKNTWTYDGKGNRLTESKNEKSERSITCYQYSDLIKEDGIWKYNYDLNGNLITKGNKATGAINDGTFEGWTFNESDGEVWKYTYDLFNRLVNVEHSESGTKSLSQVSEYKYDYRDLMVYRKSGSVCEYFAYDNDGKLLYKEKGSEKHYYIYTNSKLWCEIVEKGNTKKTYYHHTDHLGTTVCITDSTGKVIWNCEEDAFGNVLSKTNSNFVLNFTGKLLDENTNLYYFNARWYDSDMGRFITEDPIRDGGNWYVYCLNNPLTFTDPLGLYPYNNLNEAMEDYYTNYATETDINQMQFFGLINQASMGNKSAQNTLNYAFYQANKEMLKDLGDASGNASLVFLAIGLPEVSTVLGGIDTVSDAVLSIDKINNGNKNNDLNTKIEGYIELGSSIGGIVASEIGVKAITKKAIQKLVKKDIAEGYFGQNIAPELASQIVDKAGEAALVVSGVKEKKEKLSIGERIFPQLRKGGKDEKKN